MRRIYRTRLKYILLLFFLFTLYSPILAQPKHEVRAVWLTTIGGIDWPHSYAQSARSIERQKDELRQTLDRLQQADINTVLLQTRIRGTVIYPSVYEPWDGCLSGQPGRSPGYDALAFAIEECHRRGMELHAWVVTIPVGKWTAKGCANLRKRYPSLIKKIGADGYMNPESPQTARYLADICGEITDHYDIDGIHLDYIRYPETWTLKVSRQRGRDYITSIVEAISRRVKTAKPWVKMSCSPIGKHDDLTRYWSHGWNAYTTVCQDAQGWLRSGLMDELFPMMYFRGNNFYPFAIDWAEESAGRIVAPGLGIYFMSPREKDWPLSDITREMEVLRANGMGQAFFRSKFFTDDTKGIYRFSKDRFYQYPALVPPMTWEGERDVKSPENLSIKPNGKNATQISWSHTDDKGDGMLYYNVYAARECPVDVSDARNLILPRTPLTSITVPHDASRHYAVTAMDRYGNESAPLQEYGADHKNDTDILPTRATDFLPCDGHRLTLPDKGSTLDADYVAIETLQGTVVTVRPYHDTTLDVSRLNNGIYILRSLGRKGRTHRLGFFLIKRF